MAALVLGLLSLTGCDGGNLFGEDGGSIGAPSVEIVSITPSDTVDEGGILDFRLRATSERRVARFEIKLRQAVTMDTTISVSTAATDVTVQGTIKLPVPARDSLLTFSVTAVDQANSISDPVADTLFVRDATRPAVSIVAEPQNPSGGDTLSLRITGKDNFGVRSIGYVLLDANGDTLSFELAQLAGSIADSATRQFRYAISRSVPPTTFRVVGLAVDINDLVGTSDTMSVNVGDGQPPTVRVLTPAQHAGVAIGDSLRVEIELRDNGGVTSVQLQGLAFRGDPDLGTAVTVAKFQPKSVTFQPQARDTTIMRYLQPTADRQAEVTRLIVTATDAAGNVGADTVILYLGSRLEITQPTASTVIRSPDTVAVRLLAEDPAGIAGLTLDYSGVATGSISYFFPGQPTKIEPDTAIVIPSDASGVLKLVARAVSAKGIVTLTDTLTIPVNDHTPPRVEILEPQENLAKAIGDSVFVRVRVQDNGGVASLNLIGVYVTGDPTLGTDQVVTKFLPKTVNLTQQPADTTILRWLNASADDRGATVFVIATASDLAGNVAADTVVISVGGPRLRILSPPDGSAAVEGKVLPVRVSAAAESSIRSVRLLLSGVLNDTIDLAPPTPPDSVINVNVTLPARTGQLTLQAEGTAGVLTRLSPPVTVTVQSGAPVDTAKPFIRFDVEAAERMELSDSVWVRLRFRDDDVGSGIRKVGITVINRTDALRPVPRVETFANPLSGEHELAIPFTPFVRDSLGLPTVAEYEIFAFAVDAAGNCAVAVSDTMEQRTCVGAGDTITTSAPGLRIQPRLVPGRTIKLRDASVIADAVVDTVRKRLYLSNLTRNKIDVVDLVGMNQLADIRVGSQPWGLFLNAAEDTLLVANSGGTNISYVSLKDLKEDGARRLVTPNVALFEISISTDAATGFEKYTGWSFYDFSDRPQFVAIDSTGALLYSTVPTEAARPGTIRHADIDPVPTSNEDRPEVRILFTEAKAVNASENSVVLAHVDSLKVYKNDSGDDFVEIWDHVPGFAHVPDSVIYSGKTSITAAVANLWAQGSDAFFRRGTWNIQGLSMSDTTFLAASGDRGWVAFGEGATAPTGRIIMWNAATQSISNDISIADLINNASERVHGLGLNLNGSLGVARGQHAAYFFTPDLRLQGLFEDGGGVGAAMHPSHAKALGTDATTLAFIGTGEHSIRIVDTFHFIDSGEIEIRDNIVGPLKATLPFPEDNQGLTCPGSPDCVVVKLYGITDSGGVVVLNVRQRDIKTN